MSSLAQHNADCRRYLGDDFEPMNRWMDEFFAVDGPRHRRHRHHREGVQEAGEHFGERGRMAALVHILRDCGHVPGKEDYESGAVDLLGIPKEWTTTEYFKRTQQDFDTLVRKALTGLPDGFSKASC